MVHVLSLPPHALALGALLVFWTFQPGPAQALHDPNAGPLSQDDQGCLNTVNKNVAKLAKTQAKVLSKCMLDGSKGKLGAQTIEGCLTSDPKGKVQKASGKLATQLASKCKPAYDHTPTDPNFLIDRTLQKELELLHWWFGSDLDSVIGSQTSSIGKLVAKCQLDVAKAGQKCQDAKLKVYNKCKKDRLKSGEIATLSGLTQLCLQADQNDPNLPGQPDPKGKVGKACETKLSSKISKKCTGPGVSLNTAFPGSDPNGSQDPERLRLWIDLMVECEVCRLLNDVDALARDCDRFDDGLANGSCGCGDGDLNLETEECDDGNILNGDGCTFKCLLEFCGDSVVNNFPNEECDDGNTTNGDGCSAGCRAETSASCLDSSRIIFAGGPGAAACQSFADQASCEIAWHAANFTGTNVESAASCFWDGFECRGCGPGNQINLLCTNTCVEPAFCADESRTLFTGFHGDSACGLVSDPNTCEIAWHESGADEGASCHWDGFECLGCGAGNEQNQACINVCRPLPPCADPTRTIFTGGPEIGACQIFTDDRASCESAYHFDFARMSASCYFIPIDPNDPNSPGDCLGCGPNNEQSFECSNTCRGPCADVSRTVFAGERETQACQTLTLPGQCSLAWHRTAANTAATCFWDGFDCLGCGPFNEDGVTCTNTCDEVCTDPTRTVFAGGPQSSACRGFGDQATCESAWHRTFYDTAASCFWDAGGFCRGCGPTAEVAGDCANSCAP